MMTITSGISGVCLDQFQSRLPLRAWSGPAGTVQSFSRFWFELSGVGRWLKR